MKILWVWNDMGVSKLLHLSLLNCLLNTKQHRKKFFISFTIQIRFNNPLITSMLTIDYYKKH